MVMCLDQGADLHMAKPMPLPLTVSYSSKSRLVFPSWFYLSDAGSPGYSQTKSKRAVKWLCVCVRACLRACMYIYMHALAQCKFVCNVFICTKMTLPIFTLSK